MRRWKVRLGGDSRRLEDLAALVSGPELQITNEDDHYFLESPEFESCDDAAEVSDKAVSILRAIRSQRPQLVRDVDAGAVCEHCADGRERQIVLGSVAMVATAAVEARAVTTESDGTAVPLQLDPDLLRAALAPLRSSAAVEVLDLLEEGLDWFRLYKIMEIIEDDLGGNLAQHSYMSNAKRDRFTHTANHQLGAGRGARHARLNTQPPKHPLPLSDAQALFRSVVSKWLASP